MIINKGIKLAFSTNQGRMAPLFPGVKLQLIKSNNVFSCWQEISTYGWEPFLWGKQLMYYDVDALLCAGIEQFELGIINGYGIRVVPNILGVADEVFEKWRSGKIRIPEL